MGAGSGAGGGKGSGLPPERTFRLDSAEDHLRDLEQKLAGMPPLPPITGEPQP